MTIVPKTKQAWWPIVFIGLMLVMFWLGLSFVDYYGGLGIASGQTIWTDVVARPGIAIPMVVAFASGIAGFIVGLRMIVKHQERSLLVYLATLVGGLLTLFLILELIFPH
ncbi:hypothetical protein KC644_00420 [Candidatus Berkelbacteria bacterium]|nr:hypothetical protein [Candidatus Berkelbacteria bacterium]